MIQSYTKYKQFKSLVDAKENGNAVRSGLDFLRFVAEEYCRLEVYNNQECDGDDFFTYQVEKELAQVLRDEATPIESVATAQKEMAEIEKMEAYDDYCLCFFDHIREAINFRLADADTYLADLDKQIKHHTYEYKRLVNDENFDQLSSLFRFEELGKLLIKKIEFAGAVMYVMKEVLGLSEEKMIVPMDEKRGKLLLAEILDGGNFGRHFTKYAGFTHQSMGKKYFLKIWRNMHFVRYYPAEALCEPLFRTWHFFWRLKYKK